MFVNLIDTELQRKIAESDNLDENAAEALKLLLENGFTTEIKDWEVQSSNGQNVLFYRGKNYIPRNDELRRDIVKSFHDHETAGHPGEIGTYNAIRQHYWWPGLRTFIKNYVQGCGICQQFKIDRTPAKTAYIFTEGESWLALLLTICRPLSTGHCAQYRWFYYNAIVIVCQSYCK